MKILFLTDEFYPEFGANTLIINTLCKEFIKENNAVYVMPFNYSMELPEKEVWNRINIIREIPNDDKKTLIHEMKKLHLSNCARILWKYCSTQFLKKDTLRNKERIAAGGVLKKCVEKEEIDVVISICCSAELSLPLYRLRKRNQLKCKWIFYMLDPFESHAYYRSKESVYKLRKIQHNIMKLCDGIVTTELIYEDIALWEQANILKKIRVAQFPKIFRLKEDECINKIELPANVVNVVCTGSKNEEVRNSEYTFRLCEKLKNENVLFHFVGIGWTEKEIEKVGNVYLYSPRTWEVIRNMQSQADFLLNIGNVVTNQLPSKVLEYISSGIPILNIYKSEKCPTLNLLHNYDTLNINEADTTIDVAENNVRRYIFSKHKRKEFELIEKEFVTYTPKYVAKIFLNLMNRNERTFEDEES